MASAVSESVQKEAVITPPEEAKITDCEMNEVDKENIRNTEAEDDLSLGKKRKCDEMSGSDAELGKGHVFVARSVVDEVIMEEETGSMGSFEEVQADEDHLEVEDVLDELGEESIDSGEGSLLQDADGVIAFKMSLQKRLNELHDAFENFGQGGLTLSNFWTLYFETYVEPMGWKALWKQPDESPEKGSMTFRAVENVEVVQVNCANLSARVQLEDGSSVSVPINELYPLAHQENSFLSMKVSAKCIDNYRFFLNHLLFPWDSENADRWAELHLESRIQFYYDLQSGAISETLSTEVRDLIWEAKQNQIKIDELEERLGDADSEDDVDEDVVAEMLPVHMRQEEIKSRLQMLENPLWRNILNKHKLLKNRTTGRIQEKLILVTGGFTTEEMKEDLTFIASMVDADHKIRFVESLQDAVERCGVNSKIFVKSGVHKLSGLNNLEEGGSITGIPAKQGGDPIVIEAKDAGDVWLVANSETEVSLQNVTVRVTSKWQPPCGLDDQEVLPQEAASTIAFLVLRGFLKLKNVKLEGFLGENGVGCEDGDTGGVKAVEQGKVCIEGCEIAQFTTGLVIREQAELDMKDCKVAHCENGIETNPGQPFKISRSVIEKCQKFGVVVYMQSEMKPEIGGPEILQAAESIQQGFDIADVTINDCTGGSVCICSENESILENPEASDA